MGKKYVGWLLLISFAVILGAQCLSKLGSAVAAWASSQDTHCVVVIDAGHGGEDGGAVSVSGILESRINLEISLRLNDFLHLLGIDTLMIRDTDISVYTQGDTVAQRKVSDIRNRVNTVESTQNALLVSIHQNHFSEGKYRGAQVFYAPTQGSEELAKSLQSAICTQVDPSNHREYKKAQDIYLMNHITCPAVLIECGFLSNYEEEQMLCDAAYQKKLITAFGCCIYQYLEASNEV